MVSKNIVKCLEDWFHRFFFKMKSIAFSSFFFCLITIWCIKVMKSRYRTVQVMSKGSFTNHGFRDEITTSLNRFGKFCFIKDVNQGEGVKKGQKSVNVICERPLITFILNSFILHTPMIYNLGYDINGYVWACISFHYSGMNKKTFL